MFGQEGGDYLYGGSGSDQLLGGSGEDWLYGEAGSDQFWFVAADLEVGVFDRIFDFAQGPGSPDYLRFEGFSMTPLMTLQRDGYVHITTSAVGETGGIVIFGAKTDQLSGFMIFG